MRDSNYSLRFPRSYREATGHDAHFDRRDPDRMVAFWLTMLAAFVLGLLVGMGV